MSPTARTVQRLRKLGYHAAVVEQWIPHTHIKRDLFNWVDVLALDGRGFYGIQVTTGDHAAERLQKARGNRALVAWYQVGGKLAVWAWSKYAVKRKDGSYGRRKVWDAREIVLTSKDLMPSPEGTVA